MDRIKIIVIGGGAAGFFAAITAAEKGNCEVMILEKTSKLLSKVRVSGGGRCNVTNAIQDRQLLVKQYPRGEKELQQVFSRFSTADTIEWFKQKGVELKTEADGRMFPITDSSETIVNCLLDTATKLGITIKTGVEISGIEKTGKQFLLEEKGGGRFQCDRLIVAAGGGAKSGHYFFLAKTGHFIIPPMPSLFTFNLPKHPITALMGVSMPYVKVRIQGTKLQNEGPLLITHWGLSGPAILKLSAWGARELHDLNYQLTAVVNWLPKFTEEKIRIELQNLREDSGSKNCSSANPFEIPKRLWDYFLQRSMIADNIKWAELNRKQSNLLVNILMNDAYAVSGKTSFKEEFVTCGGVRLKDIELGSMQSKLLPGLYFAGELLDVDGITGGFNFQNAWSTGFLAGSHAAE